jgi:hypothetical protein
LKVIKHAQSDIMITADKFWLLLTNITFVDMFLDTKNIKICCFFMILSDFFMKKYDKIR